MFWTYLKFFVLFVLVIPLVDASDAPVNETLSTSWGNRKIKLYKQSSYDKMAIFTPGTTDSKEFLFTDSTHNILGQFTAQKDFIDILFFDNGIPILSVNRDANRKTISTVYYPKANYPRFYFDEDGDGVFDWYFSSLEGGQHTINFSDVTDETQDHFLADNRKKLDTRKVICQLDKLKAMGKSISDALKKPFPTTINAKIYNSSTVFQKRTCHGELVIYDSKRAPNDRQELLMAYGARLVFLKLKKKDKTLDTVLFNDGFPLLLICRDVNGEITYISYYSPKGDAYIDIDGDGLFDFFINQNNTKLKKIILVTKK